MSGPAFFLLVSTIFFALCGLAAWDLIRWLRADRRR
jgi:hypothetical protein